MQYIKRILGKEDSSMDEKEKALALTSVKVDNTLNPRQGALDQAAVLDYSQHLDELPPMHAFFIAGEGLVLVAGFHRYAAHELAGAAAGRFIVHHGTREEAAEFADLDNLKHGLNLNRAERRLVIGRYLKRHPDRSNVWVARECRTTDKTVESVRVELEAASEIPKMDRLIDVTGVERPRSVERPQRPDPQAEAEKLTPALVEVKQADAWVGDDGRINVVGPGLAVTLDVSGGKAKAEEAREVEVTWKNLDMDGVWRDSPFSGAKDIPPPDWAVLHRNGHWWHKGRESDPSFSVRTGAATPPEWYLKKYNLTLPKPVSLEVAPPPAPAAPPPSGAEVVTLLAKAVERETGVKPDPVVVPGLTGLPPVTVTPAPAFEEGQADETEWLSEEGEADLGEDSGEAEGEEEALPAPLPQPAPASHPEPVEGPQPVAPPPPPPAAKPAPLPPPPPPVVGRAALAIQLTIYPNGNALISALEGTKSVLMGGMDAKAESVGGKVDELIKDYLPTEKPTNEHAI